MKTSFKSILLTLLSAWAAIASAQASAADEPFTRTEDVIYRRKHGTALTLDVFTPKENANGAAIVIVISGAWRSSHDNIRPQFATEYAKRGYTVFAVVHGSSPRFSLPEILEDMHRAVRFVRSQSAQYGIDSDRIGMTGASAGGRETPAAAAWRQEGRGGLTKKPRPPGREPGGRGRATTKPT